MVYICCWVQIAYLENLLKVYNDEIYRLQQAELSLDDMETEDSTYIQEHKLKRKVGDVQQIRIRILSWSTGGNRKFYSCTVQVSI